MPSGDRNQTRKMRLRYRILWPALTLLLVLSTVAVLDAADIRCKWSGVDRIVAVADIHGDYDNFEAILKGTGLINDDRDWIGGKTHLVQLGDVLDRGPKARETFDLLKKLEKQAEKAGGKVHVLLGNHEEVNITGIVFDTAGYVTWPQYKSFLPEKYVAKMEKPIHAKYAGASNSNGEMDKEIEALWKGEVAKAQKAGSVRGLESESWKVYCREFYKNYGKWLLTKNLAIKINDIVFVHGGFSSDDLYLEMDLKELNNAVRQEYAAVAQYVIFNRRDIQPSIRFIGMPRAPQWYRGHVRGSENFADEAGQILDRLKCNTMVIGHTVRQEKVWKSGELDRFEGQVYAIDVGISKFYNDLRCALIIDRAEVPGEKHRFQIWWGDDDN